MRGSGDLKMAVTTYRHGAVKAPLPMKKKKTAMEKRWVKKRPAKRVYTQKPVVAENGTTQKPVVAENGTVGASDSIAAVA